MKNNDFQIWHYRAVVTQNNAGATTVGIDVSPVMGTKVQSILAVIGKDDYAAGREVNGYWLDSSGKGLGTIIYDASVDNANIHSSGQKTEDGAVASLEADYPYVGKHFNEWITTPDTIRFLGVTLAQNETLTIIVKAIVLGGEKPVVTVVGSAATMVEHVHILR